MRIILAEPRGFCAGVRRAIEIVERALERFGAPVYVRHEIVHNRHVITSLQAKGAIFVDEPDQIPSGAVTVFSAHGVSRFVEETAEERNLAVIDATCPLVAKVHAEGRRFSAEGRTVILIGHAGHAEVEGTLGQIPGPVRLILSVNDVDALTVEDPNKIAYITQTTLSVGDTQAVIAALKARFPAIVGPNTNDICYATQNRQQAVREMAPMVDVILVVSSRNSSNGNRLREIGEESGVPSYLIDDASSLRPTWLEGKDRIGITAAASTPEWLIDELVATLRRTGDIDLASLTAIAEPVRFRLPDMFAPCDRRLSARDHKE